MRLLLLLFLAQALTAVLGAVQVSYYISPQGNDAWSGLLPDPNPSGTDGPYLTPHAGEQAVLALPRPLTGTVNVYFRSGLYELNSTLTLGPGSGGDSPSSAVVWGRAPTDSGAVILSGGVRLSGWQAEPGQPGIWSAPLPAAAPPRTRSLFSTFDSGEQARRTPARLPAPSQPGREHLYSDASTLHYVGLLDHSPVAGPCWGQNAHNASINRWGFVYNSSDPSSPNPAWPQAEIQALDVLVFGAWTAAWGRVAALHASNSTLYTAFPFTAAVPGAWGGEGCPGGARYVLFNARAGLLPGSGYFVVDDVARRISYAPLPGEDMATLALSVPVLDTVVAVVGDDCGGPLFSITFQDLAIRHATDGGLRGTGKGDSASSGAFTLTTASDISVVNCDIGSAEGSGILLTENLTRVLLLNNTVAGTGGDGIGVALVYSQAFGYPVNTSILNNSVLGTGHVFMDQPAGIRVQGDPLGTVTVAHNHVAGSTYAGIMVGWQDGATAPTPGTPLQFLVHSNLVEDCGLSTLSDFGGIYISTSGETCQGTASCYLPTLVRNNLVRGVRGYNYGGEGVYCDENVAGVAIEGNAVGNVSGAAVYLHCGDGLSVGGNIMHTAHATAGGAFASGLFGGCNTGGVEPRYENISAAVAGNVWLATTPGGTLFNRGQIYPVRSEAYSSNVYWSTSGGALAFPLTPDINSTFEQWQGAGEDVGGVVADPLVADLAGGDFRLLPGSPALQRGFQQLEGGWGTTMTQAPTPAAGAGAGGRAAKGGAKKCSSRGQ